MGPAVRWPIDNSGSENVLRLDLRSRTNWVFVGNDDRGEGEPVNAIRAHAAPYSANEDPDPSGSRNVGSAPPGDLPGVLRTT